MLEESYINGVDIFENWNWKKECYISLCRFCGDVFISSCIISCPICGSGNIVVYPFRDCPSFNFSWLRCHGFSFLEERLRCQS